MRRTGVTCRNGTTNHENDGHASPPSVSPVPLLCVLCPALSCSLCYQVHSSARCHLFLFSRRPMNAPKRLKKRDEIKTRGFADGFRESAQVHRHHDALVSSGVQNCAKGTRREAPTASSHRHGDASVFGPNDADRRWEPVGHRFLRMNHYSLLQQPKHGHTTQGLT